MNLSGTLKLKPGCFLAVAAALLPAAAALAETQTTQRSATGPDSLNIHRTRYYEIHSDLDADTLREAASRLTAMAEEYRRRTKDFAREAPKTMAFYLFGDRQDYYAAGGIRDTVGTFDGRKLMAHTATGAGSRLWKVLQHEAFHQFAHQAVSQDLPVWVKEGLAEYFACGVWTGDGFITGLVPPDRLKRVKAAIEDGSIRPFDRMLLMTQEQWNTKIDRRNYDQAWSMVHFLIQAENGKYQQAFADFVKDVAKRRPWKMAFTRRFGRDLKGLQEHYCRWWTSLGGEPTAERQTLATVQTLTGYLARASAQGQAFGDTDAFFQAGRQGQLKSSPDQWLPSSLLAEALQQAAKAGTWSLVKGQPPSLLLRSPDGAVFTGTFTVRQSEVTDVKVAVSRAPAAMPDCSTPAEVPGR